ncbi:MAG: cytochrome P450 [Deltaproteobacteria bacterium]|nr:cytochrome P450 [Deltaproteobacteria bacterium]NNK07524.1 cytochrome P450 [Myxococcales bacterium]
MPRLRRPPGPPNRLGLGNLRGMMQDQLQYMTEAAKYGPLVDLPILSERYVLVLDPDLIQQSLAQGHAVMQKDRFTHELGRVLGQGLVTSEGALWRTQRKQVARAFIPRRIRTYADSMVAAAHRSLDDWSDGSVIPIHEAMAELTLDIVGRTLFDADVRGTAKEVGDALKVISDFYSDVLESPIKPPPWWPSPRMFRFRKAVRNVDRIVSGIIDDRRQSAEDRGDLLSALLQAQDDEGAAMSDQQLRDECITLFLAGHETTSIALANTLYLLSKHPEIEARVHQEAANLLAGRRATSDDYDRLEYTGRVIKESMRLYPPVYTIGRQLLEDFELGGYTFAKGDTLLFVQWVTHRSAQCFSDPLRFDPNRWLPERAKSMHKYAYFPFGGGPRICIGNHFAMMEAVLVLATLLCDYRFELLPGQTLELQPAVTLRAAKDLQMRLVARGSKPARAA